jgi:precorrin-6B methylase 2
LPALIGCGSSAFGLQVLSIRAVGIDRNAEQSSVIEQHRDVHLAEPPCFLGRAGH